jgi:hypothetical protein
MLFELLQQQLLYARQSDSLLQKNRTSGKKIDVPSTGTVISSAYEQLRNAAENAEDHLLLQHAIRRFLKRKMFIGKPDFYDLGEDLIIELVQAGYFKDIQFGQKVAGVISELTNQALQTYHNLRQSRVSRDQAQDWILSTLSVEIEGILNPHSASLVILYIAHKNFMNIFPKKKLVFNQTESEQYEIALYVAIHIALFKSDIAIIRHDLLRVYHQNQTDIKGYILFNKNVDKLYMSKLTGRLRRLVFKNGAPLRILKSLCEDYPNIVDQLGNREQFLAMYRQRIEIEYDQVGKKVDKGIIKSIIFILITKTIIGAGVEVPYDLVTTGAIATVPLLINLIVPPLYMASLKLGLKPPGWQNIDPLQEYIDTILYTNNKPQLILFEQARPHRAITGWLYSIIIVTPLLIVIYILRLLKFTPLQMVIFFTFLSTASFLGFRLRNRIREVEFGNRPASGLLAAVRDYFYLPFILLGQWISGKYAKINIVGNVLDVLIELPLKTVLKLVRQWVSFVNQKQEEII